MTTNTDIVDKGKKVTVALTGLIVNTIKKQKITRAKKSVCNHSDGAIKVAEYIVKEIKQNVRSKTADKIRECIDTETLNKRYDEWSKLPFYLKIDGPPQKNLVAAIALWYGAVQTGHPWDHKPKIRVLFKDNAVRRPIPKSGTISESHYHKYKLHDYFFDVWSNIHYGYVGLSAGFDEGILIDGSNLQQWLHDFGKNGDTIDDDTTIKIGFTLYKRFGRYAENLKAQDVLNALEAVPDNLLPVSRLTHWCWSSLNKSPAEMPIQPTK